MLARLRIEMSFLVNCARPKRGPKSKCAQEARIDSAEARGRYRAYIDVRVSKLETNAKTSGAPGLRLFLFSSKKTVKEKLFFLKDFWAGGGLGMLLLFFSARRTGSSGLT